jgi:hypothetical protein
LSSNPYFQHKAAGLRREISVVKAIRTERSPEEIEERRHVMALLRLYRSKFPDVYDDIGRELMPVVIK